MVAAIGWVGVKVRASWNGPSPKVGDVLMSAVRPRGAYLITEVRAASGRYDLRLEVRRIGVDEVPPDAAIHPWRWDRRGRKAVAPHK